MYLPRFTIGLFFVLSALSNDTGCSSSSHQGTIEVLVSDHPDAVGDFSPFEVELASVDLHPAGEPFKTGWLQLQPLHEVVDLTEVVGADSVLVIRQSIPAGKYDAIRINAGEARGTLLDGGEIDLGNFSQVGRIKLSLANGQTVTLLVDLKLQTRLDHSGQGYGLPLGRTTRIPRP